MNWGFIIGLGVFLGRKVTSFCGFCSSSSQEVVCSTSGRGAPGPHFQDGEAPRGHDQRERGGTHRAGGRGGYR